jgi:cytochrome b561
MHVFGIVLGWVIVAGYLLAIMKYFANRIGRKAVQTMPVESSRRKALAAFVKGLVRIHSYIGIYLVTIVLLHLLIELVHKGFFLTGMIAGGLLLFQIALGAYGTVVKGRHSGSWLSVHRTAAVLLPVAVAVHVIVAVSLRGA